MKNYTASGGKRIKEHLRAFKNTELYRTRVEYGMHLYIKGENEPSLHEIKTFSIEQYSIKYDRRKRKHGKCPLS